MMQKQAWGGRLAVNAPLIVIGLLVLGYSVAQASLHIGSEIAGALCLLLLVAGMMVQAIGRVISNGAGGVSAVDAGDRALSWVLIAGAVLAIALGTRWGHPVWRGLAAWALLLGVVCRSRGRQAAGWIAVPCFLGILVVPFREQLLLALSYPLRLSATWLSVRVLGLVGVEVSHTLTTIHLSGLDMAITDACSGIRQLEAILLIAFVLVQLFPRRLLWKVFHFFSLLPAIIAANAIRLFATVLLFKSIGDGVLVGHWHNGLGLLQVILCIAFLFLAGFAFPESATPKEPQR